jgi:hypothetical protein
VGAKPAANAAAAVQAFTPSSFQTSQAISGRSRIAASLTWTARAGATQARRGERLSRKNARKTNRFCSASPSREIHQIEFGAAQ